jgi:hypothetical protein
VAWSIPIVVQGGAWPFEYAILDAPTGVTIGQHYGDSGYGVLSWATPTVGSHSVTVRIRTQDYARQPTGRSDYDWGEKQVTFALSVVDKDDTSKFVWLDSVAGDNGNTGSYTAPKATLAAIYDTTSWGGRQLHLKAGTYDTDPAAQMTPNGTTNPAVWVGYGTCEINYTTRNIAPSASGCYFQGLTLTYGGYVASNIRNFTVPASRNRLTWFDVGSVDMPGGTLASDNATMIFTANVATRRQYISVINCSETNRTNPAGGDNVYPLYSFFAVSDTVTEGCTVTGTGAIVAYWKDGIQRGTQRNNDFNISGYSGGTGCQDTRGETGNVEQLFNKFRHNVRLNLANAGDTGTHWFARNSELGTISILNRNDTDTGPYYLTNNAVEGAALPTGTQVVSSGDEVHAASGVFDANLDLTETYSAYLGTRGAQVV